MIDLKKGYELLKGFNADNDFYYDDTGFSLMKYDQDDSTYLK